MNRIQSNLVYRYGKVRAAISKEQGFQISLLPKQKALWYRVPKAGTRSINHHFNNHVDGYYYCSKDVLLNPFYQDWFKFVIIRNPLERARSVRRQKIFGGAGCRVIWVERIGNWKTPGLWWVREVVRVPKPRFRRGTYSQTNSANTSRRNGFYWNFTNPWRGFWRHLFKVEFGAFETALQEQNRAFGINISPTNAQSYYELLSRGRVLWENLYEKREYMKSP